MLKILKNIAKLIFWLPTSMAVIILLFLLIPAGQKIFLSSAIDLFNDYSDYQVVLNNIKGNLLSDFSIEELSLSHHSDGLLYTVKELSVIWQLQSLFEKKIHIEKLNIQSLFVADKKNNTETPPEKSNQSFSLESLVIPLVIEELQVNILKNHKIFIVDGDVNLITQAIHLKLSDSHKTTLLNLNTRAEQEKTEFMLSFTEEKPYLLDEIYPLDVAYYPIKSTITGDFSLKKEGYSLNVMSENTEIYQEQFKIEGALNIFDNKRIEIKQVKIGYKDGNTILSGLYDDNTLAMKADILQFPIPAFLYNEVELSKGFLDGALNIEGNLYDPFVKGSITYNAVLKDTQRSYLAPFKIDNNFSIKKKNLVLNANVELDKKTALGVTLSTHLADFPAFDIEQPLNAKILVKSKLENLPPIFTYDLKGTLKADLVLLGNYPKPNITGNLSIDADLKNFSVPSLSHGDLEILPGIADAKILASGNIFNPKINVAINYKTSLNKNDRFSGSVINANANAIVANKQLNIEMAINADDKPTLEIFAQSDWASLISFNERKALNAKIKIKSSLDNLSQVFNKKSYQVSGILDSDLQILGTYENPQILGDMRILKGFYHDQNVSLSIDNVDIYALIEENHKLILKKCKATINDGKFAAKGYYSSDAQQFDFSLNGASATLLRFLPISILKGSVSAEGNISGTHDKPNMDITAKVENFYIDSDSLLNRALNFNVDLSLKEDLLIAHSVLDGHRSKLSDITFQSSWNDIMHFNADKPFFAKIKSQTDMSAISQLLILDKKEFYGTLETDLRFEGTLEKPQLFGSFNISKGGFDDENFAIHLKNIDLNAVANGDKVHLRKLSIQDDARGKAEFNGVIDLAREDVAGLAVNGTLNKMRLFNSDKYQGIVDANLKLDGNLLAPRLSGKIDFSELNIKVPDSFQSNVPEINVISKADFEKSLKKKSAFEIMLDLVVGIDKRAFIRGKGLDAELGGKLQITGSHTQPIFHGKLQVLKGKYVFLNKKFIITKGNVQVDKEDVYLDFRAESKVSNLTAIVEITGSPEKAKIKVSSIPVLPEDEIIAKLLFGHEIKKLTPIQAVRLASTLSSLNNMQSRGGSLDLLDKTRSLLKFDLLDVNSSDTQPFSIGAGKYLFDKVYVGGQQGATLQDSKLSIQIEATDNITIESSGGPGTSGNDIKIFWKKDY
ncbi:translocation/assembly module TamB [Candidatus Berkiella cookevillensis]|uniref:Translocation and assembly module TamB n=1 Tax=Candidatus Berkiella cookevillensis TaxID=437022 RepID=A0A0Q9YQD5_9GAMM|nr:translocation/assembly module TamB domain-containing protein [Candidatus Berkiella cookevillensis]MCS5708513.1 translocation/assembly module TamB [Candidatus Berkiella cookevillensis]